MTQIEEARKGNITPALQSISVEEGLPTELLSKLVADGKIGTVPLSIRWVSGRN